MQSHAIIFEQYIASFFIYAPRVNLKCKITTSRRVMFPPKRDIYIYILYTLGEYRNIRSVFIGKNASFNELANLVHLPKAMT